jgi:hypothetical protein
MPNRLSRCLTIGLIFCVALVARSAAAQTVQVTAANPNTGAQGSTALLVKISGKNFAPGAKTDFFLSGTTNPAGITVHGTQWISASEVDATIDIADTASIAQFDIRVTNTTGRSGKGSDMFSVVQKAQQSSANWSCMIAFDSTLLDPNGPATPIATAVQGDGGGPYLDGSQGVSCFVDTSTGFWSSGRLFVQPSSQSPRYFLMPGQSAVNTYTLSSYPTTQTRQAGYFEVWDIAAVTVGQTVRRTIRVDSNSVGIFRGDSTSTDPVTIGSSSAWVTRLTVCSWRVAWYPWAPLEAGENAYAASYPTVPRVMSLYLPAVRKNPATREADFSMPLSATVTLIHGALGCN